MQDLWEYKSQRAKETIINQLINLKDENQDKIYNEYSYEYTNKKKEKFNLYYSL